MIFGNGGSAARASHFSVDFTKNAGVRCFNFNESDLITCFSNDYGYEKWAEKAVNFYGDKGDASILISASGKSKNMIYDWACSSMVERYVDIVEAISSILITPTKKFVQRVLINNPLYLYLKV